MTAPDQTQFRHAIFDADLPVPAGLSDGQGRPAGRRFSVYRNNVAVSLSDALETGFPVIAKLLGDENFRGVAGIYLRRHPPVSPLMIAYGHDFPAFLDGFEPLHHIGYLGDVARLEYGLRTAYHAADARPLDAATLTALSPDALGAARLRFAPSVAVLRSVWPQHAIWRFNTEHDAPAPTAVAEDVLITRPAFDPIPRLLPAGGAALIAALMQGAPLADANDAAIAEAGECDLAGVLTILLQDQCLIESEPDK